MKSCFFFFLHFTGNLFNDAEAHKKFLLCGPRLSLNVCSTGRLSTNSCGRGRKLCGRGHQNVRVRTLLVDKYCAITGKRPTRAISAVAELLVYSAEAGNTTDNTYFLLHFLTCRRSNVASTRCSEVSTTSLKVNIRQQPAAAFSTTSFM